MLRRRALVVGVWILMSFSASAFAQDRPGVGVTIGANIAGANVTGLDAANINTGTKAGLFAGVVAVWPVTHRVALQPEVAYSQRHFAVNDTVGIFSATEKWEWLTVPVLARVRLWELRQHAVYIIGGPGFEFLLRAREDATTTSSDVKDFVKGADVSIIGGAGVSVGKFDVEIRYDAGLRDLNKDNSLGNNVVVKDRTVLLNVKWMLR